jgi:hypothetical protein
MLLVVYHFHITIQVSLVQVQFVLLKRKVKAVLIIMEHDNNQNQRILHPLTTAIIILIIIKQILHHKMIIITTIIIMTMMGMVVHLMQIQVLAIEPRHIQIIEVEQEVISMENNLIVVDGGGTNYINGATISATSSDPSTTVGTTSSNGIPSIPVLYNRFFVIFAFGMPSSKIFVRPTWSHATRTGSTRQPDSCKFVIPFGDFWSHEP